MAKSWLQAPVILSTTENSLQVSRAARAGRIRKIAPRLYSANLTDTVEAIIRQNTWEVVGLLFPGAVVGYRTAIEGRPSAEGTVHVVGGYDRVLRLPGLTIRQSEGPGPLEGDMPFARGLWIASRARAILESLRVSRARTTGARGLRRSEVESWLERLIRVSGDDAVNALRDHAREIAPSLGAEAELGALNDLIGAILGSRSAELTSPAAIARRRGEPYDPNRVERFHELHASLLQWPEVPRLTPTETAVAFQNVAFIDAYFSNYIEGTEFPVEDARDIVFEGRIPQRRPADAHDIIGTFRVVGSREEMGTSFSDPRLTFDDFVTALRRRHATILAGRPEREPGVFKTQRNFAGNTEFVAPELVIGTLRRGFEVFRSLAEPFARAAFMMYVVSEVHPFVDGNGRAARVMANGELISQGRHRIIIPTVFREDYLLALRALTRNGRTGPYLRMLDRAQDLVSRVDVSDLEVALEILRKANAFADSSEARLILPPSPG